MVGIGACSSDRGSTLAGKEEEEEEAVVVETAVEAMINASGDTCAERFIRATLSRQIASTVSPVCPV